MPSRNFDAPNQTGTPEDEATVLAGEGIEDESPEDAARREELAAIGTEIDSIRQSLSHIAEAASHYVKRRVAENSTDLIAENPVRAALLAALAGFLVGRLSR